MFSFASLLLIAAIFVVLLLAIFAGRAFLARRGINIPVGFILIGILILVVAFVAVFALGLTPKIF